jgi:hypothetical protein
MIGADQLNIVFHHKSFNVGDRPVGAASSGKSISETEAKNHEEKEGSPWA